MITKILLSIFLLTISLFAEQDWTRSYKEAQSIALKENKNIMVMISRETCDACWYMENIVFEDEKVHALIMNNFVPVYLDVIADDIPERFSYMGTPTFYFTKANGEKLGHRINGASNVKDFTKKVEDVLKELAN